MELHCLRLIALLGTANLDDGVLQTKEFAIQNKENKSFLLPKVISTTSSFCIQRQSGHFQKFFRGKQCFQTIFFSNIFLHLVKCFLVIITAAKFD